MTCDICNKDLVFRWTDTHGIGACTTCGATYRIYHYDGGKRIDKPPELTIKSEWVPLLTKYYAETGRNISPGAYNMPGSSYEVASNSDFSVHNDWMESHKDEFPAESSND